MTEWAATIVAVIAAVASVVSAYYANQQASLTVRQLQLEHPARLRVTNFVVHNATEAPSLAPKLFPNERLQGVFYSINYGRSVAEIVDFMCYVYWGSKDLPMYRPYNSEPKRFPTSAGPVRITNTFGSCQAEVPKFAEPERWWEFKFETSVPVNKQNAERLYIMGYIHFHDELGTRRLLLYTKVYNPDKLRFEDVDASLTDYVGEE